MDTLEFIKSRRSTRRLAASPVEPEKVEMVVDWSLKAARKFTGRCCPD